MADSSFDPLALVKAMGPQRDPYSWAELYATDAAKGSQLREELKARLQMQEAQQSAQAREHALDRGQRFSLHQSEQAGRDRRQAKDLAAGRYSGGGSRGSDNVILPKNTLDAKDFRLKTRRKQIDPNKYTPMKIGADIVYVPDEGLSTFKLPRASPGIPTTATPTPAPATRRPDPEDEDW